MTHSKRRNEPNLFFLLNICHMVIFSLILKELNHHYVYFIQIKYQFSHLHVVNPIFKKTIMYSYGLNSYQKHEF